MFERDWPPWNVGVSRLEMPRRKWGVVVRSIEESQSHLENFITCNLLWLGEVVCGHLKLPDNPSLQPPFN